MYIIQYNSDFNMRPSPVKRMTKTVEKDHTVFLGEISAD